MNRKNQLRRFLKHLAILPVRCLPVILLAVGLAGCGRAPQSALTLADPPPGKINALYYLPQMLSPLPVELALPSHFRVAPLSGVEPNINDGVIWGRETTLQAIAKNEGRPLPGLRESIIMARISRNVKQTGPAKFSHQELLAAKLRGQGVSDMRIIEESWGAFPVLALEGVKESGQTLAMAWVGLNSDGPVLYLELHPPLSTGEPTDTDWLVWRSLIKNTRTIAWEDYFKDRGYDWGPDAVKLVHNGSTITAQAQRVKATGETAVQLHNEGVPVFFQPLNAHAAQFDQRPCVMLSLRVTQNPAAEDEAQRQVYLETLPVPVKPALRISLTGHPVIKSGELRVLVSGDIALLKQTTNRRGASRNAAPR
ncbi:hypothetical protein JXA32_00020 [Candidatus Sumerlaeota bacterium]|nr:hypothetical protein [Candidatus Sumerlaeota bacterium]